MADITLTDNSSLSADASVFDTSVMGKTPSSVLHFLAADVIGALNQPLDQVVINSASIGFNYQPAFSVGGGSSIFTAGGGFTGEMDLYKPAAPGTPSPLFQNDLYGTDIEMHSNYYMALSFQLSASASGVVSSGAFLIEPEASATASAKLYLPFPPDDAGKYPTLKFSIESLCSAFQLPSTTEAIASLPVGSVFTYDAQGTVGFQAQVDLLAAVNPTSTLGFSATHGPITVTAGPSVTLGGGFSLSGEFQVRMLRTGANTVQLGYYKKKGSSFNIAFDASAGVDVTVGGYDVIAKLYGLLGDSGQLSADWLKENIPDSVAGDVQAAYQSAVQTKLSIAIDAECDTSITDQAAFVWSFDRSVMQADAEQLFDKAIAADLSGLLVKTALPAGITRVSSVLDRVVDQRHTFTFNFLGLYDYATVQDASLETNVKTSEDGQVVITNTATLTRLNATVTPFVKGDQLRKVLVEDFVATVGYSSSVASFAPQLNASYTYFNAKSRAGKADLLVFVETAELISGSTTPEADWAALLSSGASSQAASLLAALTYDNTAAIRLFLDEGMNPRGVTDYIAVGRDATAKTPGLGLDPSYFAALENDTKWNALVDAGAAANFYGVLGVDKISPPQWARVAYAWTQHILDWSSAMHSASQALQNIRQYVAQNPGLQPDEAGFVLRRQNFANQLKTAVGKAPFFDNPLGILTIFLAAPPTTKEVDIKYAGQTKSYS